MAAIASLPDPSRCTAGGSIRVRTHRVGRIAATDGEETIIDLPTQVNAVVSRTELGSSEPARRGGIGGRSPGGIETRHDSAGVEPAVINHRSGPTGGGKDWVESMPHASTKAKPTMIFLRYMRILQFEGATSRVVGTGTQKRDILPSFPIGKDGGQIQLNSLRLTYRLPELYSGIKRGPGPNVFGLTLRETDFTAI